MKVQPIDAPTATPRMPFYRHLYAQVLVAIILGVVVGHWWPAAGEALKPLGDGFIKLVKMIIAPVIFLSVVGGIAGMRELGSVGRVAIKAFGYFLIFSTLALIVGLLVANIVQPGAGMNIDPATLDAKAVAGYAHDARETTVTGFLLAIIPTTMLSALTDGSILQTLFVAILFGIALSLVGRPAEPVLELVERLSLVVFKLVGILMKAAPIGAFGAIAFTIGKYGVGSLVNLGALVATFYLTSLLFVLVILGAVARAHGL
jgi:aerobic C4-dicarboxylate transport protein